MVVEHHTEKSEIEASYIIFNDGVDCYARDGTNGILVFGGDKDYGNVDGADFTAVLEACINALPNGGKIFITAGLYRPTSQIDFTHDNVTIQGEGASTRIHSNFTVGAPNIFYASGLHHVTLDSLLVQGQGISGMGNCIEFTNCDDSVVSNCDVRNARHRCIAIIEPFGNRNKVLNNTVRTAGYGSGIAGPVALAECIVLGGQNHSVVEGNTVYDSWQGGITLANCSGSIVDGNTVVDADGQNVGYGGIDFERGRGNLITNNTIWNTTSGHSTGIRISVSGCFNIIDGNRFRVSKSAIVLIHTLGASHHNIVSNNFIEQYSGGGAAIQVTNQSHDNVIEGNNIYRCWQNGIEILGRRNIVNDNSIYNINLMSGAGYGIYLTDRANECVVDGNEIIDDRVCTVMLRGVYLYGVNRCVVANNLVKRASRGCIELENCSGCIVSDNVLEDGDVIDLGFGGITLTECFRCNMNGNNIITTSSGHSTGIYLGSSRECTINNNNIRVSKTGITIHHGLSGASSCFNTVNGNYIYALSGEGIIVDNYEYDNVVDGNVVYRAWLNGINIGGKDNVISNNMVSNPNVRREMEGAAVNYGIWIHNSGRDCVVEGNKVVDDRPSGWMVIGIRLESVSGCVVNSNRCIGAMDVGIQELGGSDYNLVIGNSTRGCTVSGISWVGLNSQIAHNLI